MQESGRLLVEFHTSLTVFYQIQEVREAVNGGAVLGALYLQS